MGISKLTTFMKDNPHLSKEYQLHSTKVVIDGNSLYHSIFYKNKVDYIHGGDYYDYALKIKEFFSLLQSCNIQPVVLFDGGNEPDDKKFETTRRRMKYRQKLLDRLATNKENEDDVVPILAFDTFKAVLDEISIEHSVCDFEADKEIGLLASKYSCPVMSNDSDFFVLPLTAGFILFDWVTLTLHKIKTENGSSDYLPARIYQFDNFVGSFPSLGENVLPMLATLVGNDYIDTKIFQPLYDHIGTLQLEKSQFRMHDPENKICKVIHWLEKSGKTADEVMDTCKIFGDEQSILSAFKITKKAFTLSKSENEKKMHSLCEGEESYIEKTVGSNNIPEWYVVNHRKGFLPPRLIDIITIHKRFLAPQMEDRKSSKTSYQCSIKIRAFMYGILLSEDKLEGRGEGVEEYDYKDSFSTGRSVNLQQILENHGTPPKLSGIENLSQSDKEEMLGRILNINALSKFKLTKDLELVMGIVLFWIKESDPKVTLYHLKSVIICMIMLKVKLKVLSHNYATGCEKSLIETAVLEMTEKDLKETNAKFLTYCTKHSEGRQIDCKLIHGFAQFQTCIMTTMHLNFLLLRPFPSPCIPHIFSGTFLYNFCLKVSVQKDPDVFIHELLLKDSKLDKAYQCLFDAVMDAIGPQGLATCFNETWVYEKRSQKRSVENPPMPISNRFSGFNRSNSNSDD